MTDRIRVPEVCAITGMQPRQVQAMAKGNKIPSSAQFGRVWTFDRAVIEKWKRAKERPTWQTIISTSEARPGGVASSLPGKTYAEAYERHLRLKRGSGSASGKRT